MTDGKLTVGQEVRVPAQCDYGSDRESGWCEEPAKFTVRGDGTEGTPCAAHLAWTVEWLTDDGVAPSVEPVAALLSDPSPETTENNR